MRKELNAVLCTSLAFASCGSGPRDNKLPNIVFILADDLGYGDLSCYGQQKFETPNIDRLARQGMLFRQHYSGCTVSAPSRACLMTGLHTGHTFIRGNREWKPEGQYPMEASAYTVAEMLKTKGYVTGAFGKWGLGYIDTEGDPNAQGFDLFYGYNCQGLAHNYYPDHLWRNHEKVLLHENDSGKFGTYAPDLIHDEALKFLEENRDKPFFMFYPTIIPHAELIAKKEYMERFRGKFEPEKEFMGVDEGPRYRLGGYASQPESHAAFAAMVTTLDDYVGELLEKLSELGLEENTIVFFSSDNGPHLEGGADPDYFNSNGDLKGFKRDMYEGGVRVPMIVRWPGRIKPASESDHISAFWDILPTVAEAAGIKMTGNIDGISFLPELLGKKQKEHKYLYWEFHEQGGKTAVRMGKWKGVKRDIDKNPKAKTELYDLSVDTGETTDISGQHPDIIEEIESIMSEAHVTSEIFPFAFEKSAK